MKPQTAMQIKERPILFSGEMVRAILDGRKTQTRRVVKGIALDWLAPDMFTPRFVASPENDLCQYGKVGDRLWVRETFQPYGDGYAYRATPAIPENHNWKPSIFMPRAASRITLEITNVRVERLNEISDKDAEAEGVEAWSNSGNSPAWKFQCLWDRINGKKYPWSSNPWVWVIEFRKI